MRIGERMPVHHPETQWSDHVDVGLLLSNKKSAAIIYNPLHPAYLEKNGLVSVESIGADGSPLYLISRKMPLRDMHPELAGMIVTDYKPPKGGRWASVERPTYTLFALRRLNPNLEEHFKLVEQILEKHLDEPPAYALRDFQALNVESARAGKGQHPAGVIGMGFLCGYPPCCVQHFLDEREFGEGTQKQKDDRIIELHNDFADRPELSPAFAVFEMIRCRYCEKAAQKEMRGLDADEATA